MEDKIKLKLMEAKRHFLAYRENIEDAEQMIITGIKTKNKSYVHTGIGILNKFTSNVNVRDVIKLSQEEID